MHNLVKDATGVDFAAFGSDLTSAKEAATKLLENGNIDQDNICLDTCPSVGHIVNEVSYHYLWKFFFLLNDCFLYF